MFLSINTSFNNHDILKHALESIDTLLLITAYLHSKLVHSKYQTHNFENNVSTLKDKIVHIQLQKKAWCSPVCQMNKHFNQTARQVAYKSYPSCVVRATDIAMEAYNKSH